MSARQCLRVSILLLLTAAPLSAQTYNPTASDPATGNTATGSGAVKNNAGRWNVATGKDAFGLVTTGTWNTGIGTGAGRVCASCSENVAVGGEALRSTTASAANVAVGRRSMQLTTAGSSNTGLGYWTLYSNKIGDRNLAIGGTAGFWTTGSDNILIANVGVTGESHTIRLGDDTFHDRTFVAGVAGVPVSGSQVLVTAQGQLGILASSHRYKKDIADMRAHSADIYKLRPVTFRYTADSQRELQYGLIAEEVATVYPELVVKAADGQIESVQYHELIPLLLNEVQQQRRMIADLTARLERLEQHPGVANAKAYLR